MLEGHKMLFQLPSTSIYEIIEVTSAITNSNKRTISLLVAGLCSIVTTQSRPPNVRKAAHILVKFKTHSIITPICFLWAPVLECLTLTLSDQIYKLKGESH
jgi:hypothetical protein